MDWTLFTLVAGTWVFWNAHFVFRSRIDQMAAVGFGSSGGPLMAFSKAITALVFLNFIVFFVIYGMRVSWLSAAAIVIGGYATSVAYVLITRGPVYDSLLNPTIKLSLFALPVLSGLLWFRAF